MSDVSMRGLLQAGAHFGHRSRYWNPKMAEFIYGERNKIHIINLEKTLPLLNVALDFVGRIAATKGKVLFVGTKNAARSNIREHAARAGQPYVDHRWLGGMLTNYKTVRQSIKRLKALESMRDNGEFERLTKKEGLTLMRELTKFERSLGGIKDMGGLPDALFVIDSGFEKIAIREAKRLGIPVIAVVDTNGEPDDVDYLIPANDDSMRAIKLYCTLVADKLLAGRESADNTVVAPDKLIEAATANADVTDDQEDTTN